MALRPYVRDAEPDSLCKPDRVHQAIHDYFLAFLGESHQPHGDVRQLDAGFFVGPPEDQAVDT
jgi:hypothetical protein